MPRRGWHLIVAIGAMAGSGFLPARASAVALPQGCSQSGQTVTCTYAAGANPFLMLGGVSSIHVVPVGGMGGLGGGHGAVVSRDLAVKLWHHAVRCARSQRGRKTPAGSGGGAGGSGGGPWT